MDTSPHQKAYDAVGSGVEIENESPEQKQERERIMRLDALGESLAKKRSEAIKGRQACGIEEQWKEDEEFYQGIDDANRSEHASAWRTKPPGQALVTPTQTTRSTVFPNITRPYVDAGAARIADMLLPTDDKSWDLRPTPIPDLVSLADGEVSADIRNQLVSVPGASEADIQKMQDVVVGQAKKILDEAKEKSDKAAKRIEDWQIESQWHAEVRRAIEDSSRCGSGILKGPTPVKRRKMALVDATQENQGKLNPLSRILESVKNAMGFSSMTAAKALVLKEEIAPTSKRVDFWNLYPDPACGDSLHNGSFVWERDYLTKKQLSDLLENQNYIRSQVEECIKEGPHKAIAPSKDEPASGIQKSEEDTRFEIWCYHGTLDREDMEAAGCQCPDEIGPQVHAVVEMVNNRVIKAAMNPLETGDFPYDIFPWQRQSGIPWGKGIARQGRTAQRITTSAVRNMMDNAGLSGGFQLVLKQGTINPSDGTWEITGRKVWLAAEDADLDDVRKAMHFFEIPSRQAELMEIVNFGMKLMEDSTGLPLLLQGQQGTAPDTVGGMTMLNNNASAVLRRLARTFDDTLTEPHLRRYYAWLLTYGEDEEKGDYILDARGSAALVERDLQAQEITQMANIVVNPIFGIDPKKWATEWLKSRKFDPKNFQFDDEEWKKIVEGMSQKPQDPRLAVAQLKVEADAQENDKDRKLELALKLIDARIDEADLTSTERQSLEKIKAGLADTAMKLTTQKQLSAATMAREASKPPTEPKGRAPKGQAYQR